MNKRVVVEQIISGLDAELLRYSKAARVAHAEATDEQSRAENKYDTRGLEASYLAHGQSRQVVETELAREQFGTLTLREFGPDEPISLGALIELGREDERAWYFLGPAAGGREVVSGDEEIYVITPQSSLGRELAGKRRNDEIEMTAGTGRTRWRVHRVI